MGSGAWPRLHAVLAHAFAVDQGPVTLAPEDEVLLDRIGVAIVRRGLAAPAALFLEAFGPLNFLGSQGLHAIAPLLDFVGNAADAERLAALLERRQAVEILRARIETLAGGGGSPPSGSGARPGRDPAPGGL